MGLADALANQPAPYKGGLPCPVALVLSALPDGDAAALARAMERASGWQNKQITEALATEGVDLRPDSIGRHRRGDCRCAT